MLEIAFSTSLDCYFCVFFTVNSPPQAPPAQFWNYVAETLDEKFDNRRLKSAVLYIFRPRGSTSRGAEDFKNREGGLGGLCTIALFWPHRRYLTTRASLRLTLFFSLILDHSVSFDKDEIASFDSYLLFSCALRRLHQRKRWSKLALASLTAAAALLLPC